MIEKLKELEQEALDNVTPEEYEWCQWNVLKEYEQVTYQCGYIDGLQTAIRIASENSTDMSYTVEVDEMFGEDYAKIDDDEDTK